MRIRTVIAVASLLLPLGAAAQIVPVGAEFQVNSYTTGSQLNAAVAAGADGAFVVVWGSSGQYGGTGDVFGQRYDNAGQVVGTEFQVNSYTTGYQIGPAVAAGADGAFVVVWNSSGQDGSTLGVFGQRYNSAGQVVGTEFQVNSYTVDYQGDPAVAADAGGAFVVAWSSSQDGSSSGVSGQRYDSAGQAVGTEFQVNSYTPGFQRFPAVAVGANGAFIVAWSSDSSSYQDGSSGGVFGQFYDSAGQAVGTEFQVNSYTPGYQRFPAVAPGADGGFVVAWTSSGQDGDSGGVFGQRYDSAGQVVGTEFQANSYTMGYQIVPAVSAGADGAFVVVWGSFLTPSSDGVFGQRFDSVGQAVGTEFQANSYWTGNQLSPAVAAGADGAFVVTWSNSDQDGSIFGVFGQRFAEATSTPTPTPTGTETQVPSATPTQTPTLTQTVTPSVASCPATPTGGCATSLKAQLQLMLNASDTKDKLKWKFSGGPALGQGDFGDPTTSATYALCLYDDGALKAELQVGPSGTLWIPVGSKGYKYTDAFGTGDGVTKINLLGGDADKSKLLLKGKGTALPMPTPVSGTRFFAQTSAVTAQLREVNGDCYATTFTDADTVKNTGTQYKAKK